jgi:hypothetical protein
MEVYNVRKKLFIFHLKNFQPNNSIKNAGYKNSSEITIILGCIFSTGDIKIVQTSHNVRLHVRCLTCSEYINTN